MAIVIANQLERWGPIGVPDLLGILLMFEPDGRAANLVSGIKRLALAFPCIPPLPGFLRVGSPPLNSFIAEGVILIAKRSAKRAALGSLKSIDI